MVVVISLLSLLGVTIVPFIQHSSRLALVYKQLITLLIAMGVSALISDALLHLIPNVSYTEYLTTLGDHTAPYSYNILLTLYLHCTYIVLTLYLHSTDIVFTFY